MTIGETDIKTKASPAYSAKKAAITDGPERRSLDLAEEAIAVDPHHRVRRHEVDGIIFDLNESGVIVSFVIEGDEVVFLGFHLLF